MANPKGNPQNLTAPRFAPSVSGNPGGKPVGARNKLTAQFINQLADDFETNGKKAIERCRTKNLPVYIKAIASLCPRELELKRPLEDMATDELIAALNALTSYLAGAPITGGDSPSQEPESIN